MTVKELIERLSQIEDQNLEVRIWKQLFAIEMAVTSATVLSQGSKNGRIEKWVEIK